ncbi:MAG: hypothetical protein H7A37_00925 [Chlamydiales bacterium]|nr:hypothetical protein [Chlamydiia bacterium]MCP5506856.1 hypothetical protein [Chlamydiales bacterium]
MNIRKKLTILIFSTICASTPLIAAQSYNNNEEVCCYEKEYFNYVKLGGAELTVGQEDDLTPAVGIGRRYECGETAIDISINFSTEEHQHSYIVTVPRIMYLVYTDPAANASCYYGAGLSYLIQQSRDDEDEITRKFEGIGGELAIGLEMQRNSPFRSFIELNLSQPIVPTNKKGSYPSPSLMATFGVGF